MKLLYKTRGDSTPQGKPRVYFTGHPKDCKAYFDEISEDILKTQNCAIYYDAEPDADYDRDELLHELEPMQLFVIPVTSRFIYQHSRALEVEFPFAMERHIPVLPLMQESGLESAFNRVCGDLQMLDKHGKDNTALPFEEKLEKFLASVLVGDELAEKVRAAFDAYVFLSYRKKDRRHAQELMRLIHKNDFCRDIAIWYDEFLTPGENFNEAINAALEKCSLFTLAVTPNIVEQGNYVMTVEYPEAMKSGKPIFPAELVPTDKDVLRACYRDLPPCTDAHDEKALSGALLEAVQKLAIRENDSSPEHNFFIGLAYLNGIDVEVDRERALSLIKGAAEDELPEAMEKLVSMYRNGDGTERDYQEAIRWQERLVAYRKKQFEQSGTEDDGIAWTNALWKLGHYFAELAKLSEAKDAYQEMCHVSKILTDKFGSIKAKVALAAGYDGLSSISEKEGDLEQAKEYGEEGLEIFVLLEREIIFEKKRGTPLKKNVVRQIKANSAAAAERLGLINFEKGRLSTARGYFSMSLWDREELCKDAPTVQARDALFHSYNNVGAANQKMGHLDDAKDDYLQALDIGKQLYKETQGVQAKRDVIIAGVNLGALCVQQRNWTEAKGYYAMAMDIAKELYDLTEMPEDHDWLALLYYNSALISDEETKELLLTQAYDIWNHLSETCPDRLQFSERKEMAKKQLNQMEGNPPNAKEAPTIKARRDIAASYDELGEKSKAEGKMAEAKEYYRQALEIYKKLYEEAPTGLAKSDLYISYVNLWKFCKAAGQLTEAEEYYLQADQLIRNSREAAQN